MGTYSSYIHQGILQDISSFTEPSTEGRLVLYEVVRVMRGVVLFRNEHMSRLMHSAELVGVPLPASPEVIELDIQKLILANRASEGNIRLLFLFGDSVEYWVQFIAYHYPSPKDYERGVCVQLLEAERTLPNAKIFQPSLRLQADALISGEGIFEVILVHPGGYVTEGSRSNFFLIRDGAVFTAPLSEVLGGITRGHVLRICSRLGIVVREERIPVNELESFEAAFLSGTSPQVLPVALVGNHKFDVNHPVLRCIMDGYTQFLEEYLTHFV